MVTHSTERDLSTDPTQLGERLLLSPTTPVTCPACAHDFNLQQGFARKALEGLEAASAQALMAVREAERGQVERRAQQLAGERERASRAEADDLKRLLQEQTATHAAVLAERNAQFKAIAAREQALDLREHSIEAQVARAAQAKAAQLFAADRQSLEAELVSQKQQLSDLRQQELDLRRQKAAIEDQAAALTLEAARQLDAEREAIAMKVRNQEQEQHSLREAELKKTIVDMQAKLNEAQRKGDQGSQQLQGEVLELALEDQLRQAFPVDGFEEVKKGARGADVVQRVTTRALQVAGTVLWEAKRAREWGRDWPGKLKEDMRAAGADVGILVTTTLPKELPAAHLFGLHEDVWVCTWAAAMPLAAALRERVLEVHKQRTVSAGKGEKMEALYDYLTSPQFAQKLKAVYGAFQLMQDDLQKERNAAEQRWARREKQIATGMKELLGFAGDVQGLAQQELPQLQMEQEKLG